MEINFSSSSVDHFNAIYDAHGLYSTEQFVLRMSPNNHRLVDGISEKTIASIHEFDFDTVKAYSTYLHETIHWWQHIGSTSGLILSLCYPLQTHSNIDLLKDLSKITINTKPIIKAALDGEKAGFTHADKKQSILNQIVNNYVDFEFYKILLFRFKDEDELTKDTMFESQGHSFNIVYSHAVDMIQQLMIDDDNELNNHSSWQASFLKLYDKRAQGYYYQSPIQLTKIGLVEIFEAQACFNQLLFLSNVSKDFSILQHKDTGRLHGVYLKAFEEFISLTGLHEPDRINHSTIYLFLLVCDLSINPTEGFPCDITTYSTFFIDVDPGHRFYRLCQAIKNNITNDILKIETLSRAEYIDVSNFLLNECNLKTIQSGMLKAIEIVESNRKSKELISSFKKFECYEESFLLRVLCGLFFDFYSDKLKNPEFFCWPGHYKSIPLSDAHINLWLKHLSLFTDREFDNGIYIRKHPNIPDANLKKTLNMFFANNLIFNLSRQWIQKPGEFDLDLSWLSESADKQEHLNWANSAFKSIYNINLFDINQA